MDTQSAAIQQCAATIGIVQMPDSPSPDSPRWERLNAAAARAGLPPDVFKSTIESGQARIRVVKLGRRALWLVAAEDVDAFRRRLAYETIE